ncbi:hypothetical protein GCM10010415_54710 [Streptomyces atrovirens]
MISAERNRPGTGSRKVTVRAGIRYGDAARSGEHVGVRGVGAVDGRAERAVGRSREAGLRLTPFSSRQIFRAP